MTQLIHEIDLMQHIFGKAIDVTATMDTLREAIESEDTCAATVRFESGALVSCQGTMTAQRSSHGFDVIGDRASAHSPWALESLDTNWRDESLHAALEAHPLAETPANKHTAGSAHTPYMADVVAAILEARPARRNYGRPIEIKVGKNGKRQANLFDPDGTRIELMEPNTADGKPVPPSNAPPPIK